MERILGSSSEIIDFFVSTCFLLFYRYALIYVNKEDEEKALRLDGSDMGGRILQI